MTQTSSARPLVLVVAAALFDVKGRVLIARRPVGKALAGLWEFPGGKVEAGEAPEAALIRELKEELGVDVDLDALEPLAFASHAYADFHLVMPLYAVRNWRGEPAAHEHDEIAWVLPGQLVDYPMPPADAPLVKTLIAAEKP
jgi:8-oxo-dGTP diphosphatase